MYALLCGFVYELLRARHSQSNVKKCLYFFVETGAVINFFVAVKYEHSEREKQLLTEAETSRLRLEKEHEEQLRCLKTEFHKLQRTHEESLDILREENDSIREQIDENKAVIEDLQRHKFESEKLRKEYETKEMLYKEKLRVADEEIDRLREENSQLLAYGIGDKDNSVQVTWL